MPIFFPELKSVLAEILVLQFVLDGQSITLKPDRFQKFTCLLFCYPALPCRMVIKKKKLKNKTKQKQKNNSSQYALFFSAS